MCKHSCTLHSGEDIKSRVPSQSVRTRLHPSPFGFRGVTGQQGPQSPWLRPPSPTASAAVPSKSFAIFLNDPKRLPRPVGVSFSVASLSGAAERGTEARTALSGPSGPPSGPRARSRRDPRRPPCVRYVAAGGARQSGPPASAPAGGAAGTGGAEAAAAGLAAVAATAATEAAVPVLASAPAPPW